MFELILPSKTMLKYVQKELKFMRILCPECGSEKILQSIGEVSCRKCGFVIADSILISG